VKVIILGCGPAGLMAAEAAEQATPYGESVEIGIVSRKQKSALYGAQYLHSPIPYMTSTTARSVSYVLRGGTPLDYRLKVYGNGWSGTVSPEDMERNHLAWDIRATYDNLWAKWEHAVSDLDVTPYGLKQILGDLKPDLMVNTIPRPSLCESGHFFGSTEVWAAGDAPDLGIDIGKMYDCPDEHIICEAGDNSAWYRKSRVFGHTTVEWPGYIERVPVRTASRVVKPLNTNCDCWPNILHLGRYGMWAKGVLSDSAFVHAHSHMVNLWGQAALF
jgi:hypothetical protein